MNEEPALVRHVFVEGRVQGVGYRDFTRGWALRLGISGWVRNRSDGAVEAVVRGAAADVEALLVEMHKPKNRSWPVPVWRRIGHFQWDDPGSTAHRGSPHR